MSQQSKIEWTTATWNPVTGCNKVSSGCKNCYAERDWKRLSANPASVYYGRSFTDVAVHENRLKQPLLWTKPKIIFVNSMSDLFHASIPFAFIDKVFAVMALCPQHTFQVLTKRADRMLEYFTRHNRDWDALREASNFAHLLHNKKTHKLEPQLEAAGWLWDYTYDEYGGDSQLEYWGELPLPNVWLGVSVENQQAADERREPLQQIEAAVKFVSYEPALDLVDWSGWEFLNWLICGFESGPNARGGHPVYARAARDFCQSNQIPFFFKQHGEWLHESQTQENLWAELVAAGKVTGNVAKHIVYGGYSCRIGKKRAGRILDGKIWDEMPS